MLPASLHLSHVDLEKPLQATRQLIAIFDQVAIPSTIHDRFDPTSEIILARFVQSHFFQDLLVRIFGFGAAPLHAAAGTPPAYRPWMWQSNFNPALRDQLCTLLRPAGPLMQILCFLCHPEADKSGCRFTVPLMRLPPFTSEALRRGEVDHYPSLLKAGIWTMEAEADGVQMNMFAYFMVAFASYATEGYRAASARREPSTNYDIKDILRRDFNDTWHFWRQDLVRWLAQAQGYVQSWGDSMWLSASGASNALQRRQRAAFIAKAQRMVRPAHDEGYYALLRAYLDHWYKAFPSQGAWGGAYHQLASSDAPRQFFATILGLTCVEFWLDRTYLEDMVARQQGLSVEELWRRYAVADALRCFLEVEVKHLEGRYRHWRRVPAQPAYLQQSIMKMVSLEEMNTTVYRGLLHYLRNTFTLHGKLFPDECLPVGKIIDLWLLYGACFDTCEDFPWTFFVSHHYELYSLIFVVFLDFASRVGLLHDYVIPGPRQDTFTDTGPLIMIRLLQGWSHPALLDVLRRLSNELLRLENTSAGGYSESTQMGFSLNELSQHQYLPLVGNTTRNIHLIPLFTADRLSQIESLLEAAWTYGPLDFQVDMQKLTRLVNEFFEESGVKRAPLAIPASIGTGRTTAALGTLPPPDRAADRGPDDPAPPLTPEGIAQILEGRRCPRDRVQVVYVGDPDDKPLLPSENARLVHALLRVQEAIGPVLMEKLSFKLRLRWLAQYPIHLLLLLVYVFGGIGYVCVVLFTLGLVFSWGIV